MEGEGILSEWNESDALQEIDDWVLEEFDKECTESYFRYGYIRSLCLDDYKWGVDCFLTDQRALLDKLEEKVNKLE